MVMKKANGSVGSGFFERVSNVQLMRHSKNKPPSRGLIKAPSSGRGCLLIVCVSEGVEETDAALIPLLEFEKCCSPSGSRECLWHF